VLDSKSLEAKPTPRPRSSLDPQDYKNKKSIVRHQSLTALVDSEYTNFYISQTFIEKEKINTQKYKSPIPYYNVNSTQNKAETIINFVKIKLNIGNHL